MKPQLGRLKQGGAAVLAAVVILLSPGLGAYEACAAIAASAVSAEIAVGAVPAGLGFSALSIPSGLSNDALSLSLSPAALSGIAALHPAVVERELPSAVPAAPVRFSAEVLSVPATNQPQKAAASDPLASLRAGQTQFSAALSHHDVSNEGAISAAAMPFEGEAKVDETAAVLDLPLADASTSGRNRILTLRRTALAAAGAAASGLVFVGLRHHGFSGISIQVPSWTTAFGVLGAAGYYMGNGLSFIFAVPQLLKTFEDGRYGAPVKRAWLGIGASVALGLISAPLGGHLFWGLQNLFGALTMAAPLLIGKIMARRGLRLSGKAVAATAAACAVLLAASFGLYAVAAAGLPIVLPALMGKTGISIMTLTIQVATGAAFLFLFAPDVSAILKKQAPKGFTSFFSLLFSASSFGFIVWALQKAIAAPAGSAECVQFIIYAVQNAVYAVVAGLSFAHTRKHEKKS
jgi:hypothetical protein